jgi:hypothetical protein
MNAEPACRNDERQDPAEKHYKKDNCVCVWSAHLRKVFAALKSVFFFERHVDPSNKLLLVSFSIEEKRYF